MAERRTASADDDHSAGEPAAAPDDEQAAPDREDEPAAAGPDDDDDAGDDADDAAPARAEGPGGSKPRRPPRRQRFKKSYCPACDAPITTELAQSGAPSCPVCNEPLLPVKVAGVLRRTAAGCVDLALLAVTAGLLNWGLLAMLGTEPLVGDAKGLDAILRLLEISPFDVVRRIIPALVMAALYFALFWAATGRTPGQRLLRLRVVGRRGTPPSPLWAVVRAVAQFLALIPGGLGWIWVAFDREGRGWHDHLAGTWVIVTDQRARPTERAAGGSPA